MNRISTGDGRVHFAACTHINKPSPLSDADATWLGTKARVATSGGKGFQGKEALIHAGGCETGTYTKTNATSDGHPEDWYSHTLGGKRRFDPHWHVYSTEPSSKGWREAHLAQLQKLPPGEDVFSDSAGLDFTWSQGDGPPYLPPDWTRPYTKPGWVGAIGSNLSYWQDKTGRRFLINGLSRDTVDVYTPTVGMVEGTFRSQTGKLPDQRRWEDTAGFVLEAQVKGWTPWLLVKLGQGSDTGSMRDAWRALAAPSALLLDAGSLLFDLCGMEGSDPPWVTREYDHPSYAPGIGYPKTVPSSLADLGTEWPGVYRRLFSEGSVWVNSTSSPVAVTRARTIPPQSGAAYKRKPRRRV